MTAIETIYTLRNLLAANSDPHNTRYKILTDDEDLSICTALGICECAYMESAHGTQRDI